MYLINTLISDQPFLSDDAVPVQLWRDSQERMIESNKRFVRLPADTRHVVNSLNGLSLKCCLPCRDAVAMLYPHVVTLLAALSPDAPNSYGAKVSHCAPPLLCLLWSVVVSHFSQNELLIWVVCLWTVACGGAWCVVA